MKSLEYVKTHIEEFELDNFLDRRFTKRFIDFLPAEEWPNFGYEYGGDTQYVPEEWTEENILAQLKRDVEFGYEKAVCQRGISSELMAYVVVAWCLVLENGLISDEEEFGEYWIGLFRRVDKHYGWGITAIGGKQ